MITKTWGEFPTAEEIKAAGVWERDGERWWMELKGIDATIADLANVSYNLKTDKLDEFFEMVRRIVTVAEMNEDAIREKNTSRYTPTEIKDEASSLASNMMQVGVGIEWV